MICTNCTGTHFSFLKNYSLKSLIIKCNKCELVITNVQKFPSNSKSYRRFKFVAEIILRTFRIARALIIHTKLRRVKGLVIDYGCGRGEFLKTLSKLGWKVLGCELSKESAKEAINKEIDILIQDDISEFALARVSSNSATLLTSFHNLEHLPCPTLFIEHAHRILRQNGTLILEVPNFGSLQSKIAKAQWIYLDIENHRFHFTFEDLQSILGEKGFSITRHSSFSLQYGFIGMIDALVKLPNVSKLESDQIRIDGNFVLALNSNLQKKLHYFSRFAIWMIPGILLEIYAVFRNQGGVIRLECRPNLAEYRKRDSRI